MTNTPSATLPQTRVAELKFGTLSRAEALVLQRAWAQDEAFCDFGASLDAKSGDSWSIDRKVRGDFLRWICLELFNSATSRSRFITIRGAHFTDLTNLSNLSLPLLTLVLESCRFEKHLDVSQSHFSTLELTSSWLTWLDARRLEVDKDFSMEKLVSLGSLMLDGATVGGDLDCTSAIIGDLERPTCSPDKDGNLCNVALYGQDLQVTGTIYLNECNVSGGINLTGAKIGGDLDCTGGEFHGYGNRSFGLEKVAIAGQIFFSDGFESYGEVWINNAVIRNGITANDGTFRRHESASQVSKLPAILIENSLVQGTSRFESDFNASGVSLRNSELGFVSISGTVGEPGLNLQNTKVRQFADSKHKWPRKGTLSLDGFVYERIIDQDTPGQVSASDRLDWLGLYPGESPQPYVQLARVLRDQGEEDDATFILEKMQARLVNLRQNQLEKLEGESIAPLGYGYHPERALWLLLGTTAIGWIIYRRNFLAGKITPTEADAYGTYKELGQAPPHYPKFSALVYSLENTFPLVNLGQASKWQPDPSPNSNCSASANTHAPDQFVINDGSAVWRLLHRGLKPLDRFSTPQRLRVFLWLQILAGWLLATLFVAGISGIIRK